MKKQIKPLFAHGGDRKSKDFKIPKRNTKKRDNEYYLARLQRDYPLVYQQYLSGKYKNVRQACIAVGFIKVASDYDRTIQLVDKLTNDEIVQLTGYLSERIYND